MNFWQILCLVIAIVGIGSIVCIIIIFLNHLEAKDQQTCEHIKVFQDRNNSLKHRAEKAEKELAEQKEFMVCEKKLFSEQKEEWQKEYCKLKKEYQLIKERYCIAEKIYPGLEKGINEEIIREKKEKEVEEAKRVERIVTAAISKEVSVDTMAEIFVAAEQYQKLNPYQKTYVEADVTLLNEKFKAAVELNRDLEFKRQEEENRKHAKEVEERIKDTIAKISTGSACNLYTLERAMNLYAGLSAEVVCYFDKSVYARLRELYYDAKSDMLKRKRVR